MVQPEGPYVHAKYNKMLTSRQHSVGVGLQTEVESHEIGVSYINGEPRIHCGLNETAFAGDIHMHSTSSRSRRAARLVICVGERKCRTHITLVCSSTTVSVPMVHKFGIQGR